jgi:hypothetical protein
MSLLKNYCEDSQAQYSNDPPPGKTPSFFISNLVVAISLFVFVDSPNSGKCFALAI